MKRIKVGMLVFPGFQLLDIAGPKDAFAEVRVLSKGECEYEMMTVGTTRGSVQSSSGLTTVPDRTIFDRCPEFDTIIVPGGLGIFDAFDDPALSEWLRAQHKQCRRVSAICNGLFALGSAGLLDNKVVTTHWMDVPRLAATFPRARIEPDHIFVRDGNIFTTAGVTAGIDLSLAMIEDDFGRQMALDVAKYLVVYLRRAGGQSQFSPLLETQAAPGSQTMALQEFMLDNLHVAHTVASLADRAHMSARNLSRIFAKDCGTTPMTFLANARIDAARHYLEATELPMREIARRCGFEDTDGFRRTFFRRLSINPVDYRDRFRSKADTVQAANGRA
ncbi:GlxA family transcriptional regulator [Caballeronia sp. LP006]|uniref:GlxA family transcriptional regulator n=1 Tax=unclassified Caballeronia TaxID=2646786 RepID=UPI001FD1CA2C|nr:MULTISPECIES: GlxA family transcriptional regulator [unclassified Caballeronia]MDR5773408.1 GlxA family transcriptional regulator [Caballeronia sp. LZ002]MDR5806183.1 GlxA family transcriptional regulator [Caballeronia sp. LZ001]MDR5826634.1 GlxA family transcriptional regulator [Caballeronia sp. LP006]MDR5848842.1 GlxA family transcriptional regulator [Caballeronia sp. LZ003]